MIESLGITDRVHYLGAIEQNKVRNLMKSRRIYVLPSDYEPFGMTLLESMSVGTPVVMTEGCVMASEIVKFGAGLVATSESDNIAQTIISAYDNQIYSDLQKNALKYISEQYNIKDRITILKDIYENKVIDLSLAGPGDFKRTKPIYYELIWIFVERVLVTNSLQLSSRVRIAALRLFGAKIGRNVIFRPRTRVKFPWRLSIGDNCWIGEGVWIHNQDYVVIEDNVVVSQESFITTGSHEIRRTMDLVTEAVKLKSGSWITSRCVILKGVTVGKILLLHLIVSFILPSMMERYTGETLLNSSQRGR